MARKGRTLGIDLMRTKIGWTVPFLAIWLLGCGNYTVTFQVSGPINTGGRGDNNEEMLVIDIVCLTPADAERYPNIANGSMRSKAWFSARQKLPGAENISSLKPDRIMSLRREGDQYTRDKLAPGGPILPTSVGGASTRTIEVHHSKALSKKSVLLIYGRFQDDKGGMADTDPIRIQPPPSWNTDIVIEVGRTQLDLVQQD